MPRLLVPEVFNPELQFRFMITTSKLPTATLHCKAAQEPQADNAPVTVDYVNSYFKVKGKTRWNDITLSCYQFEGITTSELWAYFQLHQLVDPAIDSYGAVYKHDLKLMKLSPAETPVGTWTLHGAFYTSVNWGDRDRSTDDVVTAEVAISYDYATYA